MKTSGVFTADDDAAVAPLIIMLGRRLRKLVSDQLRRELALSRSQAAIVALLYCWGPFSMSEISEALDCDKAQASRDIAALVRRELLTPRRDDNDRRRIMVDLSASAPALREALEALHRRLSSQLAEGITDQEWKIFKGLLGCAARNLGRPVTTAPDPPVSHIA